MCYYESSDSVTCDYLHLVVHCLFWHPFDANKALRKFWDLASDIAVAEVIRKLAVPYLSAQLPADCFQIIEKMRKRVPLLSAVKIAMHLQEVYQEFNQLYGISFEEAEQIFCRDCHDCWYSNGKQKDEFPYASQTASDSQDPYLQSPKNSQIKAEWKEIAESVVMEANHFSKQHGHISGDMIQQIQKLTRENYNYTEFLRKFAVIEEVMKLDTDSFDLL